MAFPTRYSKLKKLLKHTCIFLFLVFIVLLLFANRLVEPILRDRLHTLIIQGSDSLYRYKLSKLNANFFGGNVEVENLQLRVDSVRYYQMLRENSLPSLTMQLDLQKGRIRGLGVFSLIFGKQINISEIWSKEANIKLSRHVNKENPGHSEVVPLWKSIQPSINSISIDKINLDGVKLLYRDADTSESIKLQFDRCEAMFKDVRIDSASTNDAGRIGFARDLTMRFYDLKFRTPDSSYKMKAELINYSSITNVFEINSFKLQPTLEGEDFFKYASLQKSRYVIEFKKMTFTNFLLDRFIHENIISADSVFINTPELNIDSDKTLPPDMESKIGKYPHQHLLKAKHMVMIKGVKVLNGKVNYTEKAEKTAKQGQLVISEMNTVFSNVTNNKRLIKNNPRSVAIVNAKIFETSPISAKFIFHLDSAEGEFDAKGEVYNLNAWQLNKVAVPLANTQFTSLNIKALQFQMHGDDFSTMGKVKMRYTDLAFILRKTDEETGTTKTKKFLTKLVNKFVIYPSNPANGEERIANDVTYARTSSKSFFGVVWKTIFFGMQNIMMKSGRYQ